MIFKTFNSDIDKWTSKIGIFGKSFNAIFDAKNQRKIDIDDLIVYKGMSLDEAIKHVGNFWSYLYPKKEDIQKQLIDVDKLIPKIDISNATEITEKIKKMSESVTKGEITWQKLFDILPDGEKHFAKLGQQMEGQIITTEGIIKANQEARASALAHNEAIKAQTFSAKAGKVALQGLAIAGNMFIGWAITGAVKLFVRALDNAADSLEDVEARIQDNQTKLSGYTSKIEELTKKLEELNQTDVEYFSRETSYIGSQIKLYNQLAEAKQKAINDDYIKATMGSNQELYFKKAWKYIKEEFNEDGLEALFHKVPEELRISPQDSFSPLVPLTQWFKKVDDGNYITEAGRLLEEYQKLQEKSTFLQNFAINNGSNEALDKSVEETQYKIHQTADELSQYIEKIQTARDALYNSADRDDYADIIAEMDEAIANYQNIFTGNVYTAKSLGMTDLQRDLIGIRDVLQTISQDIGGLAIFDPVIDGINELIVAIKLLENYSPEEILNFDNILLSGKLSSIQEQIAHFKAALTDKEFLNELNTALWNFMPPELTEKWEKLQDTIKIIQQIVGLMQDIDSKTGVSGIFSNISVLEEHINNIYNVLSDITNNSGWIKDAIEAWKLAHNIEVKSENKSEKTEEKGTQNSAPKENPLPFTASAEEQSKSIDDFQSKMQTLSTALFALRSGEDVGMTDLLQEFPELAGQSENLEDAIKNLIYDSLYKLYDFLGGGLPDDVRQDLHSIADTASGIAPDLNTAFASIQKSYDAMHEFRDAMDTGSLTESILSNVGSLSPYMNQLVAQFYSREINEEELYQALTEHYHTDLENYGNALIVGNCIDRINQISAVYTVFYFLLKIFL